jgi:cell division protein ZapA (FtsZ GTPase activity inhibitor)
MSMAAEKMREIKISIPEELFTVFIPPKTQDHLLKAKKELLLALRSLIDSRIECLEKREGEKAETKKKIKIE